MPAVTLCYTLVAYINLLVADYFCPSFDCWWRCRIHIKSRSHWGDRDGSEGASRLALALAPALPAMRWRQKHFKRGRDDDDEPVAGAGLNAAGDWRSGAGGSGGASGAGAALADASRAPLSGACNALYRWIANRCN
jgi:hypothetical protein